MTHNHAVRILVSACLLGANCRYNGTGCAQPSIVALQEKFQFIPVCPEQLGGLATPREPAERRGQSVVTNSGKDCTEAFLKGAYETLAIAKQFACSLAILKSRSPSCGSSCIYDGTFTGTLKDGQGVTAQLLLQNGISVYSEENFQALLRSMEDA